MGTSGALTQVVGVVALCAGVLVAPAPSAAQSTASTDTLNSTPEQQLLSRIAEGIEGLRGEFPQLAEFKISDHCDADRLVISYAYRTRHSKFRGGWSSGVPNPDADGLWFYIDVHDPSSTAQIHTQPVVPRYRYEDKEVMLLMLEGAETKPLAGAVVQILLDHGVTAFNRWD